jgi:transcriptional regulator with XRE-family HTH domain
MADVAQTSHTVGFCGDPLPIFAANLRAVRGSRDLTQAVVADKAEMDMSYYGRLERGMVDPGVRMVVRVARGLGVGPSRLLDGLGAEYLESDLLHVVS